LVAARPLQGGGRGRGAGDGKYHIMAHQDQREELTTRARFDTDSAMVGNDKVLTSRDPSSLAREEPRTRRIADGEYHGARSTTSALNTEPKRRRKYHRARMTHQQHWAGRIGAADPEARDVTKTTGAQWNRLKSIAAKATSVHGDVSKLDKKFAKAHGELSLQGRWSTLPRSRENDGHSRRQ
jgi:hypothetical protein